MIRNEESCKASSCCQWNTWEEGEASFNGQGRCWSDIGRKMCNDMFFAEKNVGSITSRQNCGLGKVWSERRQRCVRKFGEEENIGSDSSKDDKKDKKDKDGKKKDDKKDKDGKKKDKDRDGKKKDEDRVGQFYFNGEEYCERHDMIRNEERCRESSCCHWNDYEEGEASFNGQGRCWSDIGTDTCIDMHVVNGEEYCERHDMLRNEERCRASSCCQWNDWEEGDASFNGHGRCWSNIGTETCTDMFSAHSSNRNSYGNRDFYGNRDSYGHRNFHGDRDFLNGENYCESSFMLQDEESCKASSCCHWNTWENGEASFNGQGRCWSDIGTEMCTDMSVDHRNNFYRNPYRNNFRDSYRNNFYRDSYRNNFYRDSYRNFYGNRNHYGSGMNAVGRRHTIMDTEESVGSNSRASCMDRCQRRGDDQMDCQRRCESEESMSGRGRDVYRNRDYYGNRDFFGNQNFYRNHNMYGEEYGMQRKCYNEYW